MKFFDVNILARYQGGTITGTSGNYDTVFSETLDFSYQSSGQGTDGDLVEAENALGYAAAFDSLIILNTNFKDEIIYIKETETGSWVDITSQAVITESTDGLHRFYKWPSVKTLYSFKITVEDTKTPNEEKSCSCVMSFEEIGDLYIFDKITPTKKLAQKKLKLDVGGVVTVNKGSHWAFQIKSKYIGVQSQADIIQHIQNSDREFFIWINSGLKTAKIDVAPYRFLDFVKCVHTGSPKPSFYKNYLNSVLEDGITFEQTGQLK